jgi:hypothetical protein
LPPPFSGLAKEDERRAAAASQYGQQLASLDPDALELDEAPPVEAPPVAPVSLPSYPASTEPVREVARPKRPMVEQPRSSALALDLEGSSEAPPPPPAEVSGPNRGPNRLPPPPKPAARYSPAPVRRGLFSIDRPTNLLSGVAVGLLLSVFPAKKLAESYETREVEPLLAELETSVEQTLAVEAGLVERPESVAARIHDGRKHARRRFLMVWLFAGVPIGIGLGLAPRPGD